ncbi:sugar phosphate isomerase/epimerase family protein [Bauldia sp.]|uniref:sugar phosphate isomerase/epimerase family protein n=1 Tax=Bauldia sp. TaxID=2575872 RepID=UPI003BA913E9
MTELPKLGAALRPEELSRHIDWLVDDDRDLELQGFHTPDALLSDWKPRAAEVRKQLASHKGRQGMHGPASVPLASNDPGVRALAQERLSQALDVCEDLGLTQMVIHSPYIHWDQENLYRLPSRRDEKLDDFRATLEPVVIRAEALNVELVIENIEDRDPSIRGDIVTHLASPALKLSIDTGHAYYANRMGGAPSVDLFVRAAGEHLTHLHLQDADGLADRHWAIGDGTVPWMAVFEELGRLSSNPRLIIEIRNKTDVLRSAEHLVRLGLAR